jgi:hypothetical protein
VKQAREGDKSVRVPEVRRFQNKIVTLELVSGEIITVKILFVDELYGDIIVNVVRTNRPKAHLDRKAEQVIAVADLVAIWELAA